MNTLDIDSTIDVLACCRSLVPGAQVVETHPRDVLVRLGDTTLRVWWWTRGVEAAWVYETDTDDDSDPLEEIEDLTLVLREVFGTCVLPAVLVQALAADARPADAPLILDLARQIVGQPKTDEWFAPNSQKGILYGRLFMTLVARSVHVAPTLVLDAATMMTARLGEGWRRMALTGSLYDCKRCRGTGRLPEDEGDGPKDKCPACGGNGRGR